METETPHDRLLRALSSSVDLSAAHRAAFEDEPQTLDDVVAVGIDTNVLKELRKDLPKAEEIFVALKARNVQLIAPSQALTEFWNNHQTFANEEGSGFKGDLDSLRDRLEKASFSGEDEGGLIGDISSLVARFPKAIEDPKSGAYLPKSTDLVKSLLEYCIVPHVSRLHFAKMADIRLAAKNPPGFGDEKEKRAASSGDFFLWCDFLLGCLMQPADARRKFLFVTNESKKDWKTGSHGHFSLIAEFNAACNGDLTIVNFGNLKKIISKDTYTQSEKSRAQRLPAAPADTDEE